MRKFILIFFLAIGNYCFSQNYPIVDTDVKDFYDDASMIAIPLAGQDYLWERCTLLGKSSIL